MLEDKLITVVMDGLTGVVAENVIWFFLLWKKDVFHLGF